jgi:hypothetical protein
VANALIEARVTTLETMMADLMTAVAQTTRTVERLSLEMADFKDEVRGFMERSDRDRRNLNKQLGEIANKQGRMAEDLVAPSVCRILREVLGLSEDDICVANVRVRRLIHPTKPRPSENSTSLPSATNIFLSTRQRVRLSPADVDHVLRLIP